MQSKSSGYFWPSFTDLMTSLFFIMLVLYVLTFVKLKMQQKATEEQLKKIKEVQASVKGLDKNYFQYQPIYKRFSLKEQIQFDENEAVIKPEYHNYLNNVGRSIKNLIDDLKVKYPNDNIQYLVVIEGMASSPGDSFANYVLSYKRALSLFQHWQKNNIIFDDRTCEIQIAGSGEGGIGRFSGDDTRNQRFLIQIIPKIGDIK